MLRRLEDSPEALAHPAPIRETPDEVDRSPEGRHLIELSPLSSH